MDDWRNVIQTTGEWNTTTSSNYFNLDWFPFMLIPPKKREEEGEEEEGEAILKLLAKEKRKI